MVRPSPFCILDEVDAPLDENNINCFIRVLDRFVQQSQFIIITHNKRTIAKADVLYGVTMEERGVSKLVGVKLTAPAQPVTEAASNGGEHKRRHSGASRSQRVSVRLLRRRRRPAWAVGLRREGALAPSVAALSNSHRKTLRAVADLG